MISWDRSKSKAYSKLKDGLEEVAMEISCHSDPKVQEMQPEIDKKVEAMASTFKSYKKLVFMTEAELKKDWSRASSKMSKIFLGRLSFLKQRWMFGTCCYEQKHLKGNDQPNYCVETASYCLVFYRNATFFFNKIDFVI